MKAIRFHRYGDADELRLEDCPKPEPAAGEVLLKVTAAAVNPVDTQVRRGDYQAVLPLTLPFIPGWDVSGVIEDVGEGVTGHRAGQAVYAMAPIGRQGTYAGYVSVPANAVARAPKSVPLEIAAGAPMAALTAWSALFDVAQVKSGQSVLVHAGAGGVGLFAIQLARRAGAHVITTASEANHPLLLELGAHEVIDYRRADFTAGLGGLDVVLDTVGGDTRERSWPVLRKGGVLVGIAVPPTDQATGDRHGVRAAQVYVAPSGERLTELAALIESGQVKIIVHDRLPLAKAAEAHRISEGRHARGKIILAAG